MSNSIVITTMYKKVESLKGQLRRARDNNNVSILPIIQRQLTEAENFLNGLTDAVDNPRSDSNVLIIKKHM